jgi:hypothetical protein
MTDLMNSLDGDSPFLFSGEIPLGLAPIMTHRMVYVHDQFFLSTLCLEFEFSFDNYGAIAARKQS